VLAIPEWPGLGCSEGLEMLQGDRVEGAVDAATKAAALKL
jgi:hypothetical protein